MNCIVHGVTKSQTWLSDWTEQPLFWPHFTCLQDLRSPSQGFLRPSAGKALRLLRIVVVFQLGFPGGSAGRESACNAGDLGWEDPLEKGTATHFSILAWRIPSTAKPGMLQSMGSQKVRQDWVTFTFMNERWAWVNIYFCLRSFILGLQEKIAAQAQKKRRQKASENSWYLFPCQTLCINFSLLQRRGCLQEPRVRHGA